MDEMGAELGLTMHACATVEEAVSQADIVVTTTRGWNSQNIVEDAFVKPGTHIVGIGTDTPGKQELAPEIFKRAKVVVDGLCFCKERGDIQHALAKGYMTVDDVHAEIGEIILGEKAGRENDEEITIFDSVGMPIQDIAMANAIYEGALKKGLGTVFTFLE